MKHLNDRPISGQKIRAPMFIILTLKTMLWLFHLLKQKCLEIETLFGKRFYTSGLQS